MASIFTRENDALNINPPTGDDFYLGVHGSDWLWAVTAIYTFSLLVVVVLAYFAKSGEKVFHLLFTISLFVGAVSYFTVASDLGSTPIATSTNAPGFREIFYAKYINWFIGWTPLITAIGLISGVSWATIVYNIALSWTWVATWLAGALVATHYKWGYFAFGTFAYFLLSASLLHQGGIAAKRVGVANHHWLISGWLVFVWLLYPIAYGVGDGGNKIGVTQDWIFIGILDVFTVPFLIFFILALTPKWDYRSLNLYFTQYGRVAQAGEFPTHEKTAAAPAGGVIQPESAV